MAAALPSIASVEAAGACDAGGRGILELPATTTVEEMEAHVLSNTPFVIRGATTHHGWPLATDPERAWTPEYLVDKVGADTVLPLRENIEEPGGWLGRGVKRTFGEFMEQWSADEPDYDISEGESKLPSCYLASLPIRKYFASLMPDYIVPHFSELQDKTGNIWMGNAGQVTKLHYDYSSGEPGMDNYHYLVQGHKVFLLCDPVTHAHLPRKKDWWRWHHGTVDLHATGDQAYPGLEPIEVHLRTGDMLFLPKLWWHQVYTLERTISLNFWFQHLGSEALKLTTLWPAIEGHLEAAILMETSVKRLRGVMGYLGFKEAKELDDDELQAQFGDHPIRVLRHPNFLAQFGNVKTLSYVEDEAKHELGDAIIARVTEWVEAKAAEILPLAE